MRPAKPERVTMRSSDVQRNFRAVVNRAAAGTEHIIVERNGFPVIVMLSVAEHQLLICQRGLRVEQFQKFEATARRAGQEFERLGLSEEKMIMGR